MALGDDHIGLDHLVLAILGGAAPAVEAEVREKGIDVPRLLERLEQRSGAGTDKRGSDRWSTPRSLPVTSRTRTMVEFVARFERSLGGSPRLLLVTILAGDQSPAGILREAGLTLGMFDE